ncbi:uncharacterized protein LACBIDRAFT_293041 [Laccaria bicolor S238N-H82]|uniref:Predicted protein n=1 Tax=Laccaria bicolor (strain S238N-H82 / ATCC MYA-4686) TaxID=486041 RepID=B0D0D0_LACBS|nr:uncharacterized protein LACBIDRAFT_293041 [Laccaria bicolor S238N-H82]EDR11433.1 predicted protein [Laccaria bicolor S238N-H82]|eukprot:XP_001877330.1 predicted protein [Laccaria bicolor S238N-H82]
MPPLKLYASVVGKFIVERELGDSVRDKVRESTIDAANQRSGRTTILLETPPDVSNTKKRKDAPMFRKPVRAADKPKTIQPSTNRPSPAPVHVPKEGSSKLRNHIIHWLAMGERTEDQLVGLVGKPSLRAAVCNILAEVAEPSSTPKSSPEHSIKLYRLKTAYWTEVRPYEASMLTDTERTNMARAARFAFKSLGIPESDPTWNRVRYRSTASNFTTNVPSTSSSGSATASMSEKQNKTDGPKRGASTRDGKEKKAKPKLDSEIMMKDESLKASKSQSNVKAGGSTHPSSGKSLMTNEALIAASRKLPGSGFKSSTGPSLPASPKPSNPRPAVGGTATKTAVEAKPVVGVSAQKVKAIRDEAIASDTDRERRRERGLERSRVHRKDVEEGEHSEDSIPLKRKKISRDHQEHAGGAPQKRRKTESGALPAVSNVDGKDGHSRPSNLEKPRQKVTQKESSPLPPSILKMRKYPSPLAPKAAIRSPEKVPTASSSSKPQAPAYTASSKPSKSNTGAKPRRRSPIYTSSEDEATESRPSRSAAPPKPLPTSSSSNSHCHSSSAHQASSTAHSRPRAVAPRPLPTDRASLRARYNASYLEYLGTFQKLYAQKGKIDSLLKNNELSTGSITDSDGDVELMDQEELASVAAEHKKLHDELETIQHIFTNPQKGFSID